MFLRMLPAVLGLKIGKSVVSLRQVDCLFKELKGNAVDVYAILAAHADQLVGEVSPVWVKVSQDDSKLKFGKVMLTTLLKETSTDPNDYHIEYVQQYLSRDKTVRQYRYKFCDLTRRVTVDDLARRVREASVVDELSRALGFPLLRVTDRAWGFDEKYNYFRSSYHDHKEYQEWKTGVRRIYVFVEKGNDASFGELSRPNDFTDDWRERNFEKAILTTLLWEEGASANPDDYIVNHVGRCLCKDGTLREYQIDFFDLTQNLAQDRSGPECGGRARARANRDQGTVVNCVRKQGTLAKLNKALDTKFLHVGDWSRCGYLEQFKNTIDKGFWKFR